MRIPRKLFSPNLAVLVLVWSGGIVALPTEAGDNETISLNATSVEAPCPGIPRSYYEELDCKPVFKKPEDKCPVRYTCDNFEKSDAEMCFFRGKAVAPGASIDTGNPCDIGCSCHLEEPSSEYNLTKMAVVNCAIVDCPLEMMSSYDEDGNLKPCVPKKSHDECCASETVCFADAEDQVDNSTVKISVAEGKEIEVGNTTAQVPKKLAICLTADNKTYVEGQEFYLDDLPCKVCICQPGYTAGESGEPWCRDVRCGTVLEHTREIRQGCVPLYYGNIRCCPIGFHCPNANDTVTSDVLVKIALNPDETCKFGELNLRVGDRVTPRETEKCIECKCEVPPFVTCHQKTYEECS
ncbi:uncharacterized protein LOC124296761 [Neodiprion virginianus]|uniref:uncharacterized protein LOC124296761 n=1 Tax=Neodiprion virginianus TaxID=2961670 RepID=UPI001EE744E5|nr:uncharacterized protein LOC124296761 [Neodiprion virginianus]